MCSALKMLSEEEAREMKTAIDDLVAWKSRVTGGLFIVAAIMGLVGWMVNRTFEKSDDMTKAIISLEKEVAVFRQEVQPFITAGPRFTSENYDRRIAVDTAALKDWVRQEFEKREQKNHE